MFLIKNKSVILFVLIILLILVVNNFFIDNKTTLKSNELIRLHVVANSDNDDDQNLKKKIRNKIINQLDNQFTCLNNIRDVRKVVFTNIPLIENIAINEIKQSNKNYSVKATLGKYPFPTKWYGNFILPAGDYEALKVVLGEGKGANWWCVLFPPLCFVDITSSLSENPKELNEILNKYNLDEDDVNINIKIKFIEIIKEKINKIKNMS